MRIGTDLSIAECRSEGYTVIDFKVRELYPNGRKQPLDKECNVLVTISFPPNWTDGRPNSLYGADEYPPVLYIYNDYLSWNDAYEMYIADKASIDSLCGIDPVNGWTFEVDNPSEYDLLSLIDSVNSYKGLE